MQTEDDREPLLGEFSHPDDDSSSAGLFSVTNGRPRLELIGPLRVDRLDPDFTGIRSERAVPSGSDAHETIVGLLWTGEAVTLVRVAAQAWTPLFVTNSVQWARKGKRFSENVGMSAEYAVMNTMEDSEPLFDRIDFSIPALEPTLNRTGQWRRFEPDHEAGGYLPTVIPQLDMFRIDLPGELVLELSQRIRSSDKTSLEDLESARFAFSRPGLKLSFRDCLPEIRKLQLLAEFASGSHAPVVEVVGLVLPDEAPRAHFPIFSPMSSPPLHPRRSGYVGLSQLVSQPRQSTPLKEIAARVHDDDPLRAQLIASWWRWIECEGNAELIREYLRPLHAQTPPSDGDAFRSTIGVLEAMCHAPASRPRVEGPDPAEVADRKEATRTVRDYLMGLLGS